MNHFNSSRRKWIGYVCGVSLAASAFLFLSQIATAKPPTAVQHGDPEKALNEARKDIEKFREAFVQLCKLKSVPVAVTWMYSDDFEFVDLGGKKLNRAEFIQSGRITTQSEEKKQLEKQGGKQFPLTEKQRFWRPERIEVSGRQITVYSWPVSKNIQPLPTPDGSTKMVEVKVIGTDKQLFIKQDNGLLRLKRQEIVDAKILVDGKVLPKEMLESKVNNSPS